MRSMFNNTLDLTAWGFGISLSRASDISSKNRLYDIATIIVML
jgi:hypothetical protein